MLLVFILDTSASMNRQFQVSGTSKGNSKGGFTIFNAARSAVEYIIKVSLAVSTHLTCVSYSI